MTEWQPIETAPKDGSWFWLSDGFMMRVGRWASGERYEHHGSKGGGWRDFAMTEAGGLADLPMEPTHWQPLPEPPE